MYARCRSLRCVLATVRRLNRVLRRSQSLDLTPSDLVQLINLRPTTPVEAHVVRVLLFCNLVSITTCHCWDDADRRMLLTGQR